MSDLELLLEKVRTAEAGSQEMDAEICVSVQYGGHNSEGATNVRTDPDWEGDLLFEIGPEECCNPIPPVTTSLDAIVALIERELPGWQWAAWGGAIELGSTRPRCLAHVSEGQRTWDAEAPTAPLALCAAFLSAKTQTGSGGGAGG